MEASICSRSWSLRANGNRMPTPRSKPSRITYIATAMPMMPAQISGRSSAIVSPRALAPLVADCGGQRLVSESFRQLLLFRSFRDQAVDVVDADREHDA